MSARTWLPLVLVLVLVLGVALFVAHTLGDQPEPEPAVFPPCPEVWSIADAPCIHDAVAGDGYWYVIRADGEVITLEGGR